MAMIEAMAVTLFPLAFLSVLFGGDALLRRRNIDPDGTAPIQRQWFYASKYSIILIWAATAAHAWGFDLSFLPAPSGVRFVALGMWAAGFLLLLVGRFGMGSSFRIGSPREETSLKVDGLFRLSRNPMYLGVFLTLAASVVYTMNPVVLVAALLIAGVHHRIVLAEEKELQRTFGREYTDYCRRVRRYL